MTASTSTSKASAKYHHGNLRQTLLAAAKQMIAAEGMESLSLRKLSYKVGVSRTAAYHYFDDKNDLLCAIASDGFRQWQQLLKESDNQNQTEQQKFEQYFFNYMIFATHHPEQYELMFGRCIWKQSQCTEELQTIAHNTFQHQVDMMAYWQSIGLVAGDNPLRTAQIIWGTLHGIAKLFIDGVYVDDTRAEEIVKSALPMFLALKD
jgi:AcrR family transcriptional regulator